MSSEEQINEAFEALKDLLLSPDHTSGRVIHGDGALGEANTRTLVENGYLKEVIEGWYVVCLSGKEDASSDWYEAYWPFVVAYLNDRFGGEWSLSPDCSLEFYSGKTLIPEQLVVRSKKAQGDILRLPFETAILTVKGDIPDEVETEPRYGIHLYQLPLALLLATPDYFKNNSLEVCTCLAMIDESSVISHTAIEKGLFKEALRVAAGLRCIGKRKMAERIGAALSRSGYEDLREPIPFEDTRVAPLWEKSPQGNRIRLMWTRMREEVLIQKIHIEGKRMSRTIADLMVKLEKTFSVDAVNALAIDGYDMTEEKLESLLAVETPDEDLTGDELIETLVVRGYHQAYEMVKRDILDSLTGGESPAKKCALNFQDWNYSLFLPGIRAEVLTSIEYTGYRRGEASCIPDCRHIPYNPDDIIDALRALSEMIQLEEDPFVRAVLGSFFLMYIQPFPDGNEETAKFIMNSQLVCGGYPWIVLYSELKEDYLKALKSAVIDGKIREFTCVMVSIINHSR